MFLLDVILNAFTIQIEFRIVYSVAELKLLLLYYVMSKQNTVYIGIDINMGKSYSNSMKGLLENKYSLSFVEKKKKPLRLENAVSLRKMNITL